MEKATEAVSKGDFGKNYAVILGMQVAEPASVKIKATEAVNKGDFSKNYAVILGMQVAEPASSIAQIFL